MNFRNPQIIRIWGSHVWGCWHLVGLDREGHSFREYLPSLSLVCRKTFSRKLCGGNSAVFLHWLNRLVSSYWNSLDRRSASQHFTNEIIEIRYIYLELYGTLLYITKRSFSFGLKLAVHRPVSNWTHNIPRNNRFLPDFHQIGRRLGEWRPKKNFVTDNRGDHA